MEISEQYGKTPKAKGWLWSFKGSQTVEFVIFKYDHSLGKMMRMAGIQGLNRIQAQITAAYADHLLTQMNGDSIPDADHVLRHVNGRLIQGEDIDGSGFRLRENEPKLSFNWMEYYRNCTPRRTNTTNPKNISFKAQKKGQIRRAERWIREKTT